MEPTTVADDLIVLHDGARVEVHDGLDPDTEYEFSGLVARTLPRPPGERLSTVATVNDLHLGETVSGLLDGVDLGPPLSSAPGEPPYPETMCAAAAAEIEARSPDAVLAKGDLTARGRQDELDAFLAGFGSLSDRLHYVPGNHDAGGDAVFPAGPLVEVGLPGVVVALLDTSVAGHATGTVSAEQAEQLDELGARAHGDRPVLVFGHHPPYAFRPGGGQFGMDADAAGRLVDVFVRRPALAGYFAGHTHRNSVTRLDATGDVPWVEVAAVKDFPGGWAEYRVYEGGILQVFHRISSPAALAWTERTRAMFGGLYPSYSFGALGDRCFLIRPRAGAG